jgi:hypothetical protein
MFAPPEDASEAVSESALSSSASTSIAVPGSSVASEPSCVPGQPNERSFACSLCSATYTTKFSVNRHMREKHPQAPGLEQHLCVFCSRSFNSQPTYQAHVQACRGGPAATESPSNVTLLDDSTTQGITSDFIAWLGEGALTPTEVVLKGTRLVSEQQLKPVKSSLRWLLNVAVLVVPASAINGLSVVVQEAVVRAVLAQLEQQRRGPERIYQLCLLLKKIIVFLCSRQSRQSGVYVPADRWPTWMLLDNLCHQAGKKRKQAQRDRLVLNPPASLMSEPELHTVIAGCLAVLAHLEGEASEYDPPRMSNADVKRYCDYLITALLASTLAPRQQTFRALTTDTLIPPGHPTNSSNEYIIRISAEFSKTGMPVLLSVPAQLTAHMTWYLTHLLPAGHTGPVFLQRGGDPRQDFSSATRAVTLQLIGRAVSAHAFRASIVTMYHSRPDTSEAMMRTLANAMGHSSEVQRSHYAYQNRLQHQAPLQSWLMRGVPQ